ncbi:MAG: glycine--tRNA ligase subunit beta [Congregibacter sp.]
MSANTLLFELGCEELPSSSLKQLGEALPVLVSQKLTERGLSFERCQWFAAPRRLAVQIDGLIEQAPDETKEALGPPVAQAKDDSGDWTKAAIGFAKRQGLSPDDLEVFDTPKGERLGIRQTLPGAKTRDCLTQIFNEAVAELPVAKRMRWGASRKEFARPVHWVVLMYGAEHSFGKVMEIESGNQSFGHRFHAPDAVTFNTADEYQSRLRDAHVVADFAERQAMIVDQVDKVADEQGAKAHIDEALLDEVTSLVEWPVALAGKFDEEFLKVPAEALISSMQSHQKYFPVMDASGGLMPAFITVSNIESRDPSQVIKGNERVIRPRLADAAFFFEQDLQQSLEARRQRLDAVVFQDKLGSLGDKSARIEQIAGAIAESIGADVAQSQRAAQLCKADLVSEMVLEFADMQGIAGAYYARNDGEDAVVADAIEQHYWPKQSGSELPRSKEALAVALADRLDTLYGIFGIGQIPSGSKDPFALRRASIGILRMLIENALPLDLRDCLGFAAAAFEGRDLGADTNELVLTYLLDRLPALYENEALPIEAFRAVRAVGCTHPMDFDARLRAVQAFQQRPEAEALAAANKRVSNILAKAEDRQDSAGVNTNLLHEAEEKALHAELESIAEANQSDLAKTDYAAALARLATLRDSVDAFFDGVMVNAEDAALKANRLALLGALRAEFLRVADVSQLAA